MKKIFFVVLLMFTLVACLGVVSFASTDNSIEVGDYITIQEGSYTTQSYEFSFPSNFYEVKYSLLVIDGEVNGCFFDCIFYDVIQGIFGIGIVDSTSELYITYYGSTMDDFGDDPFIHFFSNKKIEVTSENLAVIDLLRLNFVDMIGFSGGIDEPSEPEDPSDTTDPGDTVVEPKGVYFDLYDIFVSYIYGDAELTSEMRLTATVFSTALCVIVLFLPFLACLWICKFIFSWRI